MLRKLVSLCCKDEGTRSPTTEREDTDDPIRAQLVNLLIERDISRSCTGVLTHPIHGTVVVHAGTSGRMREIIPDDSMYGSRNSRAGREKREAYFFRSFHVTPNDALVTCDNTNFSDTIRPSVTCDVSLRQSIIEV
jgi:hypothetical protein